MASLKLPIASISLFFLTLPVWAFESASSQVLGLSTNATLSKRQNCVQGQSSSSCPSSLICALAPLDNGFYCCPTSYNYYCVSLMRFYVKGKGYYDLVFVSSYKRTIDFEWRKLFSDRMWHFSSAAAAAVAVIFNSFDIITSPPPSPSQTPSPSPTAAASSPSPTPTASQSSSSVQPSDSPANSNGSNSALIGGISGALALVLILGAVAAAFVWKRRRTSKQPPPRTTSQTTSGMMYSNSFPLSYASSPSFPQPVHVMPSYVAISEVPSSHSSQTALIPTPSSGQQAQAHWLFLEIAARKGLLDVTHVEYDGPVTNAIGNYVPTQDDEVAIFIGHIVRIKDVFRDGWGSGSNLVTGAFGMFPLSVVDLTFSNAPTLHSYPMSGRDVSLGLGKSIVMQERDRMQSQSVQGL
ncbi:hypothetical protein M427DRAFT_147572 [Gonapodya prolifera JEL478]|uniref:SH3 domain-containing protein n=1 Tax=Gonapodya prolifera (strain JEL478) TaxID=1344416 RepID=A0A139A5F3_GONPJ|nr:hypothetical protein M427DRAFT_147572 [Gonapodya prolifera JEL478]|eukprot:KXS11695.1 hypothetical protein M427DRAFT_147572 [Gonapodya prolifera JEL478]